MQLVPGATVSLPHFLAADDGTAVQQTAYQVGFVIFHLGKRVSSGKYQLALSVPNPDAAESGWTFHICDDRSRPRPGYLVGVVRS